MWLAGVAACMVRKHLRSRRAGCSAAVLVSLSERAITACTASDRLRRLLVAVLMNVIQRTAIHHLASGHLRTITPSPFPYSFMTETTTSETKQLFKLLTKLGRGGERITTPVIRYNQCLIWAPLCFPGINDGDFGSLIGNCIA